MIADRTQSLEENMAGYQKRQPKDLMEDGAVRAALDSLVTELKALVDKNQAMEKEFMIIKEDVGKMGDMQGFLKGLDELDETVGSLDGCRWGRVGGVQDGPLIGGFKEHEPKVEKTGFGGGG